ncbi:MAG: Gfo/Idh/MocA family protein, partial [Phycisphaerae bacterium]
MKLAMIGSYGHAGVALDGVAELDDVELVAAARWGEDDPLGYVGRHKAAPASLEVYDDYRRMLMETKPDLVGVFMPLYRNAEAALAAVGQGCHVISEKPLATKLEDFNRLKEAVEQAGVSIGALMTMRGESTFQAVRDAVAQGKIGHPVLASGQKSYPFASRDDYYKHRETYGGSILWQAIHALDFIHYTTGRDYTRVAAMNSNACHPTHPGMEDNGGLLLELSGGGHAVVWFDYLRPWSEGVQRRWGDDRLRIAGTEGIVEVVDEGTRAVLMTPTATGELPLPKPKNVFVEFVNSLTGRGGGLITPTESFRITEVALKARDAADTGE